MITHLFIKDYILIDHLDIDLREGFTAITGETGAGKSILIGAIGLILGARAESKSIKEGAKKSVIEAEFDLSGVEGLKGLFEENDLDYSPLCILRRELTQRGSRAFVNDTPVSAVLLRQIGERLVDIHSQHHNMLIGDTEYQLGVLDILAGNEALLEEYREAYEAFVRARRALKKEEEEIEKQRKEEEFIRFQVRQFEEAKLKPGELEEVTEKLSAARHASEIIDALTSVSDLGSEDGVTDRIAQSLRRLSRVTGAHTATDEIAERLESLKLELQDLTAEAETLREDIELDPEEKEALEARADEIQSLLFKHKASDMDDLIRIRDDYRERLNRLDFTEDRLRALRDKLQEALSGAEILAERLRERRQTAAGEMDAPLHVLMKELGIAGATFKAEVVPSKALTPTGGDEVRFLFATNKASHLEPIRDVASGGEISRFMLALKTILAKKAILPTVIFDEIDTGVSGEAAEKVGRVMQELSRNLQVLAITHLPQIASLADRQLLVYKEETNGGFKTGIKVLDDPEERAVQIASMLSGTKLTEAALENARLLLENGKKK
ncbi:MAG: DNA repair protein RecN [Bacteroidales bacterium]|nr:DNA repair protein RecN [Bacteroidales bacterium]